MNDATNRETIKKARESFTGQNLTESQADIVAGLTGIIDRHIHKTGSFREPLTDYAHAFARSEKFDAMKGEMIIRDFYKARYGRTMNTTRETLLENEKNLPETAREQALQAARQTLDAISKGKTEPFYKSYDREGSALARELSITESGAKHLMSECYQSVEGRALYEAGKKLEEKYHRPNAEAARQERIEAQTLRQNPAR
ncbi:hypothetical protein [Profundibacter amoris]|uniref:Uncharacterized protein n=1 Tax=Profundibacter amoris TaxID=2171755 RepID=A0A347UGW6_9RHOB|nr:hypothetical protein [Profundibacter amoris]AXX98094.1 hypothetical protein BAR1_09205 [Profundibacter amoris]